MSLYRKWKETLAELRGEVAVIDVDGREWTFAALSRLSEDYDWGGRPVALICGGGVNFLGKVIAAWRDGVAVVPCEDEAFDAGRLAGLPDWVGQVKMTSGSGGEAKLVVFRDEAIAADAEQIVRTMGLTREWANVGAISMAHSYGFSNLVTPLLLHGIPLALADSPLPVPVRSAIERVGEAGVVLPGVPAMWRAWARAGVLDEKVKLAVSAGAPLSVELEREIYETCGIKVRNFYGSSECGGIAFDRGDLPRKDGGHVGQVMEGVEVACGGDGRLRVRSAAVGGGFWPLGSYEGLGDGEFVTGDLGELRDGEVVLSGRVGDVINVAGRKIDPGFVERIVEDVPGVRHCVVFGCGGAERERGDEVVACVSLETGTGLDEVQVQVRRGLAAWMVPRRWHVDAEVEPDARGKLSRAKWKQRYGN